ncbi:unnamed protein product, partial [Mesorhabditis spiculigera]
MLTLLLILVLKHSVMAMGDDVDADFDLGYAILLGGLFLLLVYQLMPQRKNSYEDEDPDRDILKTTPVEYSRTLESMIAIMAVKNCKLMAPYPDEITEKVLEEETSIVKDGIANKAVTLDLLKRVCLRLARGFAITLSMSISSLLQKFEAYPDVMVPGRTSDEQLRNLVATHYWQDRFPDVLMYPPEPSFEQYVYGWVHSLEFEGNYRGPEAIEEYLVSLAEEVIDKLTVVCIPALEALVLGGVIVLLAYYLFPRSAPQPIPDRRPIVIEEDEEKNTHAGPEVLDLRVLGRCDPEDGRETVYIAAACGQAGLTEEGLQHRFHNIEETLKTALITDGVEEDGIDTSGSHVFCQFEAGTASVRTTCPVKKGTRLIGVLSFKLPAEAAGLLVKLAKEMADDPEGFMGKMAIESIADVPIDKYETRYIQFHRLGYYICVKGPDVPLPTRRARLDRVAEVWKRACREQDIALFRVVVFHIDAYHATWFTSDFLLEMPDDMVVLGHLALETYKMG